MVDRPKNYRALILLIMIYLSITLAAGVMVNKIVMLWPGYVQGGAIITPLWYSIADVITEVYGYKISRQILWGALISQFIFSLASFAIIHLPSPSFWHGQQNYNFVFGNVLRIYFSGLIAFLISGFVNIYCISKWKILMLGKYFWIRNIGATIISEIIYTVLIIPMIALGSIPLNKILIIIISSYGFKILYAFIMAWPATRLVRYLKKLEGVDVYDYNVNFNPFIFGIESSISETQKEFDGAVVDMKKYKK